MLRVTNLSKIFSSSSWFSKKEPDFIAVNNISFSINEGEVVGLLGPNGAGKTTTIQMLIDVLTPTSGTISYFGKNFSAHRSEILQQVAFGSAYTNLPGKLTIRENLEIFARLYQVPSHIRAQRINHYAELFGITQFLNRTSNTLSAGQKTRAMLAKTFMVHPKMVILDEPTSSLDPDIAHEVRSLIINHQKEHNLTVLLASHNMDEVTAICNRVIVLSKGTIIADDTPHHLARSISNAQVELIVADGLKRMVHYAQEQQITYRVRERIITFSIDERAIAPLLVALARLDVHYDAITIQKPTLEDYFLEIARASRTHAPVTETLS